VLGPGRISGVGLLYERRPDDGQTRQRLLRSRTGPAASATGRGQYWTTRLTSDFPKSGMMDKVVGAIGLPNELAAFSMLFLGTYGPVDFRQLITPSSAHEACRRRRLTIPSS